MKIASFATTIAVLAIGASAQAVNIATWTFETFTTPITNSATSGNLTAEAGINAASSFASGVHASAGTDYSSPAGNGSARSFSSNEWAIGDYYQFTFDLTGYNSATISWDQARSNSGPSDFNLAVSTDGVNFTVLTTNYLVLANASPNPTWNSTTANAIYSFGPTALGATTNNASAVTVRMIMTGTSASTNPGPGGTNRIDNVTINAEAIPEPATMMVLGLGLAAAAARRKRK